MSKTCLRGLNVNLGRQRRQKRSWVNKWKLFFAILQRIPLWEPIICDRIQRRWDCRLQLRNYVLLFLKKRSVKTCSYEGLIHRELLPALKTVYHQLWPSDLVLTKPFYTIINNGLHISPCEPWRFRCCELTSPSKAMVKHSFSSDCKTLLKSVPVIICPCVLEKIKLLFGWCRQSPKGKSETAWRGWGDCPLVKKRLLLRVRFLAPMVACNHLSLPGPQVYIHIHKITQKSNNNDFKKRRNSLAHNSNKMLAWCR